ncbi:shikimate dehydrogenase [Catenovulum sp. SM1970]|uniref:shikimate dehydrogenase n=1 Tax=Marinifaba aquimaris TaxID=2741323 RepID=UPI0015726D1F|nr:shikimate dehydrogenase [Marinifaba aquimaris]NTS78628.1 shikimate dehydrogenase [Marinifaba aquimaris]
MDKYAVFGNPISHSKSPLIHTEFAKQTEQALQYTAIKAEIGQFAEAVNTFVADGGKGCNVTVPFKEDAFKVADHISERAQLAEAVNTLTFNEDGTISADNTDGAGLVNDLQSHQAPLNKRILLIGAGGAARGVIKPLLDCQPEQLVIFNRTHSKAQNLAEHFADYGNITAMTEKELEQSTGFDVVINSTSASLSDELPPVPATIFSQGGFAYDMAYGNKPTVFVEWALSNGCQTSLDGLGMLVGQAAVSFEIWREVKPETQTVIQALRQS